ncbi:hypothetical protein GOP47_0016903 [Adiantum capillus-veneris]|uniref:Uncharacterized protein n=1 Tax=Adiantum capillus-veneris TaxID=13818 RepID=A0A9D4ZAR8_ADICA|nr:hypothetical protein GOP47_0016903 [Adiantum capillus-veneris]
MSTPHSLVSLPTAASRPALTSSARFLFSISCSSKRKKKASAKPKVITPAKPTRRDIPEDDFSLGIGGGASTLTALQPLTDEQDTLIEQKQKLELQLSQQKVTQKPSFNPSAQPTTDPLSWFTLAAYEPQIVMPEEEADPDADVDSTYDAPLVSDAASYELEDDEGENDTVEEKDDAASDAEFEWVEVNALSSDLREDSDDEDVDEEVEVLSADDSDIDEYDEAYLEADAALAHFEKEAKRKSVSVKRISLNGSLLSEDDTEDVSDNDEDEVAFISRKSGNRRHNMLDEYDEEDEKKQPKRGIPAVMRSFDKAKVYVKAGNGGNGVVAFRREKYVPFGGPSGGSGGRGGHVYVRSDPSLNSLLCFRKSVHFRAGRGSHGMGKSQDGAAGTDCIIDVPLGTVIREAGDGISGPGEVLLELTRPGQCELLLSGGRGGRGNTAFKTGRNKTPQLAENGEEGAEMWLELELKLVADVGIIGVPNAGKSTLLSVISAAQPAIGAYPFTTLLPNLGVVPIGFESTMVVADLPGLLEGAHLGIGLGHEFLRHTERCRVLVHMIDGMSQQPEQEYEAVRLELQLFNPLLSEKPYIVAFNKMDIPEAAERWPNFRDYLRQKGIEPICISAVTKAGVTDVVNKAYSLLQSLPSSSYEDDADKEGSGEFGIAEKIRRQRSAPIEEFEIIEDKASKTWQVQGAGLQRFTQMTNWEYFEALTRFQHVLTASGVNKALKERGVAEGDTVIVGQMEFVWHDTEDIMAADWKRGFRGSRDPAESELDFVEHGELDVISSVEPGTRIGGINSSTEGHNQMELES